MGANKQLKSDKIGSIIALHNCGKSQRQIARQLDIAQSSVNFWISRHKSNGAVETPTHKSRSGRPRKTSLYTDKLIKRTVLIKPTITSKEIKSDLRDVLQEVSERTIRHRLQKELGLPSRHAARKPLMPPTKPRPKQKQVTKDHGNDATFVVEPIRMVKNDSFENGEDDDTNPSVFENGDADVDADEDAGENEEMEEEEEEEEEKEIMKTIKIPKAKLTKKAGTSSSANDSDDYKPRAKLAKVMKAKGRGELSGSTNNAISSSLLKPGNPAKKISLMKVVLDGLVQMDGRKGVSMPALKKFVMDADTNSNLQWEKIRPKVKVAIEKGMEDNLIIRPKGSENASGMQGSFKINMKTYNAWQKNGAEKGKKPKHESDKKNIKETNGKSKDASDKEKLKKESLNKVLKATSSKEKSKKDASIKQKQLPDAEQEKKSREKTVPTKESKSKSTKLTTPKKALSKKVSKIKHRRSISDEIPLLAGAVKKLKKSKSLEELSASASKSPNKKIKKTLKKK